MAQVESITQSNQSYFSFKNLQGYWARRDVKLLVAALGLTAAYFTYKALGFSGAEGIAQAGKLQPAGQGILSNVSIVQGATLAASALALAVESATHQRHLLQVSGNGQALFPTTQTRFDVGTILRSFDVLGNSPTDLWFLTEKDYTDGAGFASSQITLTTSDPTQQSTQPEQTIGRGDSFTPNRNPQAVKGTNDKVGIVCASGDDAIGNLGIDFMIRDQNGQSVFAPAQVIPIAAPFTPKPSISALNNGDFAVAVIGRDSLEIEIFNGNTGADVTQRSLSVSFNNNDARISSLTQLPDGTSMIAYEDQMGTIRLAKFDAAWNIASADYFSFSGSRPNIQKLSDGNLAILYLDQNGQPAQKIVKPNGFSPTDIEILDRTISAGQATEIDVARSPAGDFAMAYKNSTGTYVQTFDDQGDLVLGSTETNQGLAQPKVTYIGSDLVEVSSDNGVAKGQVFQPNQPVSVTNPVADFSLFPGQRASKAYRNIFSNPEPTEPVTYSATAGSLSNVISNATHVTFAPVSGEQGSYTVTLTGADGLGPVDTTFTLTIGNRAPQWLDRTPFFWNITEGKELVVSNLLSQTMDPDGDSFLRIELGPNKPSFLQMQGADVVRGYAPIGSAGIHPPFTVSVKDMSGAEDTRQANLQVNAAPSTGGTGPLVRESVPDIFVPIGPFFSLDLGARPFFTGATSTSLSLQSGATLPIGFDIIGSKITGTPQQAYTIPLKYVATNADGTTEQKFNLRVDPGTSPLPQIINLPNSNLPAESGSKFFFDPSGIFGLSNSNPDILSINGTAATITVTKRPGPITFRNWFKHTGWLQYKDGVISGTPGMSDTNGLFVKFTSTNTHGSTEVESKITIDGWRPLDVAAFFIGAALIKGIYEGVKCFRGRDDPEGKWEQFKARYNFFPISSKRTIEKVNNLKGDSRQDVEMGVTSSP